MPQRIEYIEGEKIGECFFVSYAENDKHQCRQINARCQCGNVFTTKLRFIKDGTTKSCGCRHANSMWEKRNKYEQGGKVGLFTFIEEIRGEPNKKRKAKFMCYCGNEFVTHIESAKNGRTKSCGCMTEELQQKARTKYPPKDFHESGVLKIPFITPKNIHRFWSKVALTANPNKCWIWQGCGQRYGGFGMGGATYKSNRVAYFIHYGQDPGDMEVMHSCDNPKCCNPAHLSLGTHYDNMRDMADKGRVNKGSRVNTAKLKEEDIVKIRRMDLEGVNKKDIAKQFSVSSATIYSILTFKIWDHVE
jgi:hypothetical protein